MQVFAEQFSLFAVFFTRILSMFSVAPFFAGETMAFFHRVALAFVISLIVVPVTPVPATINTLLQTHFFTILLEQAVIGLMIGFSVSLLFAAFQMAGEFFSMQMGFGISEVFDPLSQISLPLMGSLKNLLGLYVFFISGAHLWLIRALAFSYERIPYLPMDFMKMGSLHQGVVDWLTMLTSGMFIIALKLSMPVLGVLLLVSVALGFLSKAAPQMNMMQLGFPLKIVVGFLILGWSAPVIVETMMLQFDVFFDHLDTFLGKWPAPR